MHHRMAVVVVTLGLLAVGCGSQSDQPGGTGSGASPSATSASASPAPVALAPNATGLPGAFLVRTVPGKTRCSVAEDQVKCVVPGGEFPEAPADPDRVGSRMASGAVDVSGAITWSPGPGEDPFPLMELTDDNFSVLDYGQTYAATGWTIQPTEEGTFITNDRTGHGISITIDNATLTTF